MGEVPLYHSRSEKELNSSEPSHVAAVNVWSGLQNPLARCSLVTALKSVSLKIRFLRRTRLSWAKYLLERLRERDLRDAFFPSRLLPPQIRQLLA